MSGIEEAPDEKAWNFKHEETEITESGKENLCYLCSLLFK
jgi:hypothetical protein